MIATYHGWMRSDYDRCEALKARGETRAWLGVVFVGILKLDESDRAEVMTELTKAFADYPLMPTSYQDEGRFTEANVREVFADLLWHDRKGRKMAVEKIDAVCEELLCTDFFGTEGQIDPRGDHRE